MPENYYEHARYTAVIDANLYCFLVNPCTTVHGTGSENFISPFNFYASCWYVIPLGMVYTFFNSLISTSESIGSFCSNLIIDSCFIKNTSVTTV